MRASASRLRTRNTTLTTATLMGKGYPAKLRGNALAPDKKPVTAAWLTPDVVPTWLFAERRKKSLLMFQSAEKPYPVPIFGTLVI